MTVRNVILGVSCAIASAAGFCFHDSCIANEFLALGDLTGGPFSSEALGVDASGATVVGSSAGSTSSAFVWTDVAGMVAIAPNGFSAAVSSDGFTIVGASMRGSNTFTEPFRWTEASGLQFLPAPPSGPPNSPSHAADVSGDGSVVVGGAVLNGRFQAFRWTESSGYLGLGEIVPGGAESSSASAVSNDGQTVVGAATANGQSRAFRWTATSGMQDLGDLPGGEVSALATGISSDGSVVIGMSTSAAGIEAFRWNETNGIEGLGFLPELDVQSTATASAYQGHAIVGISGVPGSALGTKAFLWTDTRGMRSLQTLLENEFGLGPELTGWSLTAAIDISSDGRSLVGRGINPAGNSEAWIVRLDRPIFVPEPSAVSIAALFLSSIIECRRRVIGRPRRQNSGSHTRRTEAEFKSKPSCR